MEWRTLKEQDLPALLAFCRANEEYYSYMEQRAEEESLREQLTMLPPKAAAVQKHFVGLWGNGQLAAILDLITHWPREGVAYIGWFMVAQELQRSGLGCRLMGEVCGRLKAHGFRTVRLGCVENNLPGLGFWQACDFAPTGEVVDHIRLLEKQL